VTDRELLALMAMKLRAENPGRSAFSAVYEAIDILTQVDKQLAREAGAPAGNTPPSQTK
jgi:hypothetical protein